MTSLGLFSPNITTPTHYTATNNTLLDLFFVNNETNVLLYDQLSASCFSRHDLIFMVYNFELLATKQVITFRDFKNIDFAALEYEFFKIDWSCLYYIPSVDDQLSFLEYNLRNLFNQTVPLISKIVSQKKKQWFSSNIKAAIRQRDLSYSRWKRFKTTHLLNEYRIARKETNKMIKKAKSDFYANKFSSALGSKETWQTIREIGIGKTTTQELCTIDADTINKTFLNIPMIEPDRNYYNNNNANNVSESNKFFFTHVDQCDVLSSCLSIKSNAVGVDGIHPKFLKLLLPQLLPFITFLFNKIITTSHFPTNWKNSKIVPIPKSSSEYRPIAILPFLSKVFERLVHNQITFFLNNNNLLTDRQSGFRTKHSCITALVDVAEEIRKQVDRGNIMFLVLLDHSKAFDTVDHGILYLKLKNMFNFSSSAICLLSKYLSNRYQYVETTSNTSESLPVTRGVPQGSILGPLLFTMYLNDLPDILTHCGVRMYADDVQLYISCNEGMLEQSVIILNQELHKIYLWTRANGLGINPQKSKCIVIRKRLSKINFIPNIFINNQCIEMVNTAKNLGIIFNNTLTWSDHIKYACGRTFSMVRTLWRTQYCTPIKIRILLAKTYLIPILLYGCELFASCDTISKNRLNVTFNNIIRYVYGLKRRARVSTFAIKLYGICFKDIIKTRILIFMHKIIYMKQPEHLYAKLNFSNIESRGKRLIPFRHYSLISLWQFFIHAIHLWNLIPNSTQLLCNAQQFKKSIRNLFTTSII